MGHGGAGRIGDAGHRRVRQQQQLGHVEQHQQLIEHVDRSRRQRAKILGCMVTDTGGIDDRSFNASSWAGMQAAAAANSNITVKYLQSTTQSDYTRTSTRSSARSAASSSPSAS